MLTGDSSSTWLARGVEGRSPRAMTSTDKMITSSSGARLTLQPNLARHASHLGRHRRHHSEG